MATKSKSTASLSKRPAKKSAKVRNPIWRQRVLPAALIVLFALVGTVLLKQILAANTLSYSLYATHPYASQAGFDSTSVNYYTGQKLCTTGTFCPVGQTLIDMGVSQAGELVAGYGDWNANVDSFGVPAGRVGVVPLNLSTGTWGPITVAGSEALDVIREVNGSIYAPTTDPSDTLGSKSGFVTNQGGTWHMVFDGTGAVHTLDIGTSTGTDLLLMGSIGGTPAQATVWRSVNGGAFSQSVKDISTSTSSGYERYYWGGSTGGKFYVRANGTNPATPTRVFDGTAWGSTSLSPCTTAAARMTVNFAGKIVCRATPTSVNVFDGATVRASTFTTSGGTLYDFYVKDGYLYVLSSVGVYRTDSNVQNWTFLGAVPAEARSIAVYNNYVYLGGLNGKIFKSTTAIDSSTGTTTTTTPTTAIDATSTAPTSLVADKTVKQVVIQGTGLKDATVKLGSVATTAVSSSDTQVTVNVNTNDLIRKYKLTKSGAQTTLSVTVKSPTGTTDIAPSLVVVRQ